jgi:predicted aspartyl protease
LAVNPAVIEFTRTHLYTPSAEGISVPVALASANRIVDFLAYVDTGASHCLFERRHAEMLNLDVEAGEAKGFRTAAGRVDAFGHLVTIETFDLRFESVVYFFGDERINKNLLGRVGWLDRIRLGLIDHDGELYVARYD